MAGLVVPKNTRAPGCVRSLTSSRSFGVGNPGFGCGRDAASGSHTGAAGRMGIGDVVETGGAVDMARGVGSGLRDCADEMFRVIALYVRSRPAREIHRHARKGKVIDPLRTEN